VDYRTLRVAPSNLPQELLCANLSDLVIGSPANIDTDAGTISGVPAAAVVFQVVPQGGGAPDIAVFSFRRVDIQSPVVVGGSRALAILSCEDFDLGGSLQACGRLWSGGAGGFGGGGSEADGQGYDNSRGRLGAGENADPWRNPGGGGGGHGGTGGAGGDAGGLPGGAGGQPCGGASLVPLVGGAGGGGGGTWIGDGSGGGIGGGGGGAVQLVAGGTLRVLSGGGVNACGAGGGTSTQEGTGGGGGGAGGAILLEALDVVMDGTLGANGGGGGGADGYGDGIGSTPGEDGRFDVTQAAGGDGSAGSFNNGGDGGRGCAGGWNDGEAGQPETKGGGGGGACGRIRINSLSGAAAIGGPVSPEASTGLFSQGTVSTR
jgi:hypothetical protein